MQDGVVPPLDDYGQLAPLHTVDDSPITYTIAIENDLNGAGLLYFARYVAMMNYAERTFLLCRLHRPFSLQLNRFLRCWQRAYRRMVAGPHHRSQ